MFVIVKENLFSRSLIGTTMQDGGIRERRGGHIPLYHQRKILE